MMCHCATYTAINILLGDRMGMFRNERGTHGIGRKENLYSKRKINYTHLLDIDTKVQSKESIVSNEPMGSIKGRELLDQLSDC
jgi:hypothetical protein